MKLYLCLRLNLSEEGVGVVCPDIRGFRYLLALDPPLFLALPLAVIELTGVHTIEALQTLAYKWIAQRLGAPKEALVSMPYRAIDVWGTVSYRTVLANERDILRGVTRRVT